MKVKLLKGRLGKGKVAVAASVGIMLGRMVVERLADRCEKAARQQEQSGCLRPATQRSLRAYRIARGILQFL